MQRLKEFVVVCLVAPLVAVFALLWNTLFEVLLLAAVIVSVLVLLVPVTLFGYGVLYDRDDASVTDGHFTAACKYINYSGSAVHTISFGSSAGRKGFACPFLTKL